MALIYKKHTYGGLNDYLAENKRGLTMLSGQAAPPYAHPMDGGIIQALDALPVKSVLRPLANKIAATQSAGALSNGVVVSSKSFPEVWRLVNRCAQVLGISPPMTVAIGSSELNAYTSGTDEKAFICVSSTFYSLFSFEEACFVIGHECGHIHCRHVMYHMLYAYMANAAGIFGGIGTLISRTAGLTLNAWSRRSEISSDRAGLLCCGDLRTAERALVRFITGFAAAESVNMEDYLEQAESMEREMPGTSFGQLFLTHPSIPRRIRALRLFADSNLYYDLSGKEPPAGKVLICKEELDQRVGSLIQ